MDFNIIISISYLYVFFFATCQGKHIELFLYYYKIKDIYKIKVVKLKAIY